MKRKYGGYIEYCISDVANFHIIPAYEILRDLLDGNKSPDDIKDECEGCLNEHLWREKPDLSDVDYANYAGEFEKFYRKNHPK